jgi:hypothetical protein
MASGIENIPSRKLPAAKWAPPDLVELYNSGSAQANADVPANPFRGIVADHLLTKFVTDFRMETFWNALKPHWNQRRHSEVRQPLYGATLLYICQQLIADWRGMPEETTARRIARFRKIERWAAGLLKELESSGESRHLTADRCMDDASIIALWRVLAPNPIRCIAGDSPPDWDDELRIVWLRMTLSDSIPAFTEQLRGCLEFASSMIKAGGSTRPELGNARADHKARHLAQNLCR